MTDKSVNQYFEDQKSNLYELLQSAHIKELNFFIPNKKYILHIDVINEYLFITNIIETGFTNLVNITQLITYLYENKAFLISVKKEKENEYLDEKANK